MDVKVELLDKGLIDCYSFVLPQTIHDMPPLVAVEIFRYGILVFLLHLLRGHWRDNSGHKPFNFFTLTRFPEKVRDIKRQRL